MSISSTAAASFAVRPAIAAASAAAFPEHLFPPAEHLADAYHARVSIGRERMAAQRVVICGLVRDLAPLIPVLTARLEHLGRLFADFHVVLYENDSRDATRRLLQDWSDRQPRATLLTETRNDPVNPGTRCLARAARMARYRNRCHRHVAQEWPHFDSVIVADTDLAGGWSYDGIADTFGHDEWDGVGTNGLIYRRSGLCPNALLQYDAWAFRPRGSDAPLDCRTVNHLRMHRGEPLLPVNSCFGGLAVYRMPAFLSGQYAGGDTEHMPFHRSLREAGFTKLFLNPSQIAVYGRHPRRLDPLVRLWHRTAAVVAGRHRRTWCY